MSELARRSGVPAATIKHYLREGLLPEPRVRTGRNMAYYDAALVSRIRAIKELQQKRFLPLKVIRDVLEGADPYRSEETQVAIARALGGGGEPPGRRSRAELLASGMDAAQLDDLKALGLVTPELFEGAETYRGDDLALLRTLGAARKAGLGPEMLPHTILGPYLEAVQGLVRLELSMFREGVLPRAGDDLDPLVSAAVKLSEQLVVRLRRKMLLPTLRQLVEEQRTATSAKETPNAARRSKTARTKKASRRKR